MRRSPHHPSPVKILGDMTLYEGMYGKVFGGCDPDLKFTPYQRSYPALVMEVNHKMTRTMRATVKSTTLVSPVKSEKEFPECFEQDEWENDRLDSVEKEEKLDAKEPPVAKPAVAKKEK